MKRRIITYTVFFFLVISAFFFGLYFREIKSSIFKATEEVETVNNEEELEDEEKPQIDIKELGYLQLKNVELEVLRIPNGYIKDIVFDFVLLNNTLKEGIKSVSLVGCEYTIDGGEVAYFNGERISGSASPLEKQIFFNEEGDITLQLNHLGSKEVCSYDEEGFRQCEIKEKNMTINSCVVVYSSDLPYIERGDITTENYLKIDADKVNSETDVYELVRIDETFELK